jgi:Cyclin, N-terminal domain
VVVFTALFLLARLKERFPAARGSSGHRLFISAFMIASKVICDDTYSNKSWCIVGQNLYTLKEVNQMEREMCSYLEWLLHVEAPELETFTQRVKKEYGPDCGPNPPQWVSTPAAAAPMAAPAPITPVESVAPRQAAIAPTQSYPSPTSSPPTPSRSNQSSPETSDEECLTPPSGDDQVAIAHPSTGHSSMMNTDTTIKAKAITSTSVNPTDPSFAFAGPTIW